eukprot:scaffold825_cov249-Pinguiococcus_pyrenoidosus.AAC.50
MSFRREYVQRRRSCAEAVAMVHNGKDLAAAAVLARGRPSFLDAPRFARFPGRARVSQGLAGQDVRDPVPELPLSSDHEGRRTHAGRPAFVKKQAEELKKLEGEHRALIKQARALLQLPQQSALQRSGGAGTRASQDKRQEHWLSDGQLPEKLHDGNFGFVGGIVVFDDLGEALPEGEHVLDP